MASSPQTFACSYIIKDPVQGWRKHRLLHSLIVSPTKRGWMLRLQPNAEGVQPKTPSEFWLAKSELDCKMTHKSSRKLRVEVHLVRCADEHLVG